MSGINTPESMAMSMSQSLMRENEILRAEVASLKERRDAERKDFIGRLERSQNKLGKADMKINDLTQQLAAAQEGWKLVPVEPTPEIIAGAAIAAWPTASINDIALAKEAAKIVLMKMDMAQGMTVDSLAATLATMAPAYRAMLAASPALPQQVKSEDALERLRVRNWTREMSDAWHQNIPDTGKAFDALIAAAISAQEEKG